jgi:hypothetical protein
VILIVFIRRLVTRQPLFHETVEDNLTPCASDEKNHWKDLEQWTSEIKQSRLNPIEGKEKNIKDLVNLLLEKDPWKRPKRVGDLLFQPYFASEYLAREMEGIEAWLLKNYKRQPGLAQEGKFTTPSLVMKSYNPCTLRTNMHIDDELPVDHSLRGMESEVNALADCPQCAEIQAQALAQILSSGSEFSVVHDDPHSHDGYSRLQEHAARTRELSNKLREFKAKCHEDSVYFYQHRERIPQHIEALYDEIRQLREGLERHGFWYYGCNTNHSTNPTKLDAPKWPPQSCKGQASEDFRQPMCERCRKYCLDWTSISEDFHYVLHERCSEKMFPNGIRDKDRPGMNLKDFIACEAAQEFVAVGLKIQHVASMRFYTSHSFRSIVLHLRHGDDGPHPLPSIVENIVEGLKKLRTERDGDATKILWRGLSNVALPPNFKSGTENALMSTSHKFEVALQYAIKQGKPDNILFRIVTTNNSQRGVDLKWLSMFPAESEVLYPPFTLLQADSSKPVAHIKSKDGSTSFRIVTVFPTIS